MKNHWLEKRRTKEQREKVLQDIVKNGIIWYAPQKLSKLSGSSFRPKKKVSSK